MLAEEVVEIMFRIPNLMPFQFFDNYKDVVEEYTFRSFPISEEEFNGVREYLETHLDKETIYFIKHPEVEDNRPGYEEADEFKLY